MQQTSEIYTCAVQTPTLRGRLCRTHKARGRPLSICSLIVSLFISPRLAPPRGQSTWTSLIPGLNSLPYPPPHGRLVSPEYASAAHGQFPWSFRPFTSPIR